MVTTVLAGGCGALAAIGVLLALAAHTTSRERPTRHRRRTQVVLSGRWRTVALALAAACAAWWATGWPVAGVAATAGVVWLPVLLAPSAPRESIALGEALTSWTRRVADLLASGAGGLDHALARSAATAPEPLTEPVRRLAETSRAVGAHRALTEFADDLADPWVDELVLALLLRLRTGGRGLADLLHAHATSLSAAVAARREVEADRAKPRTTVRCLVGLTLAMITGLMLFAHDFLTPFNSPSGQVALAGIFALMAASLRWMHRLASTTPACRYLGRPSEGST
ncbi:pilus assembly protein TadB [Allosaccharopolyspora coralli]|uniref:Pilus assembly protein TadB n=1 Tax=Allosaccharopolyspora coralli TaxID=2665642 RepID=A0A5Q3QAR6_9PSEU|nr:pilus assembly protein TadB [Allosaccharopolyspora coralli]QGK70294.1 pilus assembly protein TadB [Allosaccharopolyspora coralli]